MELTVQYVAHVALELAQQVPNEMARRLETRRVHHDGTCVREERCRPRPEKQQAAVHAILDCAINWIGCGRRRNVGYPKCGAAACA